MEITINNPSNPKANFAFNHYGGIINIADGYANHIILKFTTWPIEAKKGQPVELRLGFDAEKADERLVNFVRQIAKDIGFELKPIKGFRR